MGVKFAMKRVFSTLAVAVFCWTMSGAVAQAKPDNVDGINVPSGRVPQEIVDNRYPRTYYPNTEKLGAAEMRITALGTGMPNQSPSNVAAAFLVELGNGDTFLFDMGTGSTDRLAGLEPDYSKLDKVFVSPCTPTMPAISRLSGSADGWVAVTIHWRSMVPRARPRNSEPRCTSTTSGRPGPGTLHPVLAPCPMPAVKLLRTSSISPRPPSSMTRTASKSQPFLRSIFATALSAFGWIGTG